MPIFQFTSVFVFFNNPYSGAIVSVVKETQIVRAHIQSHRIVSYRFQKQSHRIRSQMCDTSCIASDRRCAIPLVSHPIADLRYPLAIAYRIAWHTNVDRIASYHNVPKSDIIQCTS